MAFQTTGARHTASLQDKPRNLAEHFWNLWWNIVEPCGTRVESLQNFVEPCNTLKLRAHSSWNPETLIEPYLKPPQTTPQPLQNLVEPCWNLHGTLGGILVEPSWTQTSPDRWWNPGGTLVEPLREPSSNHPAAGSLRRAGGNVVETWWNPRGHPGPPSPRR